MPIDLDNPLEEWKKADKAVLEDLQGNILKGHGRGHTVNLFLKFDTEQPDLAREFVRNVAQKVTSSLKQFEDTEKFKITGESGEPFVAFFLTHKGYKALCVEDSEIPDNAAFVAGLKQRGAELLDPPVDAWDEHFQQEIHAMILIGEEDGKKAKQIRYEIERFLNDAVEVLGEEIGLAMKNENLDGIEHFGYVDGRSQPLLLTEEIERENNSNDGTSVWNAAFPLRQALVADKGGKANISFGSYFVFRKLEQNVRDFKAKEAEIAEILGLTGEDAELAGAMIVGRFEDGTPVVNQRSDGNHNPVPNNFNYASDKDGLKCPFHAHIRKSNPRGESVGTVSPVVPAHDGQPEKPPVPSLDEERSHIMARRGITYGKRVWTEVDGIRKLDEEYFPVGGVGLLFMAYQYDIDNQFEYTQIKWVNDQNYIKPATGLDPVIGQGEPKFLQKQPKEWGEEGKRSIDFHGFVSLKGGEYFFAPCLSFLLTL